MTPAPLCSCGCGKPVRQQRAGTWRTYASRACVGRQLGAANIRAAGVSWRTGVRAERWTRHLALLRALEARHVTMAAALEALIGIEQAAYHRGYLVGRDRTDRRQDAGPEVADGVIGTA